MNNTPNDKLYWQRPWIRKREKQKKYVVGQSMMATPYGNSCAFGRK